MERQRESRRIGASGGLTGVNEGLGEARQTVSVMSIVARWCKQIERGEVPQPLWLVFHARHSSQPAGYMCAWSTDRDRACEAARRIPQAMVCRFAPGDLFAGGVGALLQDDEAQPREVAE
jgi:hypothetical protein